MPSRTHSRYHQALYQATAHKIRRYENAYMTYTATVIGTTVLGEPDILEPSFVDTCPRSLRSFTIFTNGIDSVRGE